MELSEFLKQLEPITGNLEAQVKTQNWNYQGKLFRKVTIIWVERGKEKMTLETVSE